MNRRSDLLPWLAFAGFVLLTAMVYWPALGGGFLFDDRNLIESPDIHVARCISATGSGPPYRKRARNQFRALGMLTFAANYYFAGLDPFWLKLTNVVIHLLNGLLLFLLLRELFQLWRCGRLGSISGGIDSGRLNLTAATIAGAWLLLPINLTGVAYVSQRLESLANGLRISGASLVSGRAPSPLFRRDRSDDSSQSDPLHGSSGTPRRNLRSCFRSMLHARNSRSCAFAMPTGR